MEAGQIEVLLQEFVCMIGLQLAQEHQPSSHAYHDHDTRGHDARTFCERSAACSRGIALSSGSVSGHGSVSSQALVDLLLVAATVANFATKEAYDMGVHHVEHQKEAPYYCVARFSFEHGLNSFLRSSGQECSALQLVIRIDYGGTSAERHCPDLFFFNSKTSRHAESSKYATNPLRISLSPIPLSKNLCTGRLFQSFGPTIFHSKNWQGWPREELIVLLDTGLEKPLA